MFILGGPHGRVVKNFVTVLNHLINSPLCVVCVRAPHVACETRQVLLEAAPGGFSRVLPF